MKDPKDEASKLTFQSKLMRARPQRHNQRKRQASAADKERHWDQQVTATVEDLRMSGVAQTDSFNNTCFGKKI